MWISRKKEKEKEKENEKKKEKRKEKGKEKKKEKEKGKEKKGTSKLNQNKQPTIETTLNIKSLFCSKVRNLSLYILVFEML